MTRQCSDYGVLTVTGLHGGGPGHWQMLKERVDPAYQRIKQLDWGDVQFDERTAIIEKQLS